MGKKLKQIFTYNNMIKFCGFIIGLVLNVCLILFIYWLGTLMEAHIIKSIIVANILAYPLAELARKIFIRCLYRNG